MDTDTVLPDVVISDIKIEVAALDECLAAVTTRSTVYAREIFEPLATIKHPAVEICVAVLKSVTAHVDGTQYLHYRDFLDPLLDLRAALQA